MAALTVRTSTVGGTTCGTTASQACAGGGDSFVNDGLIRVLIVNGHTSPQTVTFDSPATCNFGASANAAHDVAAVSITNATSMVFGPFDPLRFNDVNGAVQITYSGVTAMTIVCLR
jgi:hypothetical protein